MEPPAPRRGAATLSSGVRPKSESINDKVALYSFSTVEDPPYLPQPSTTPRTISTPKSKSHHPPVPFLPEQQLLATLRGSRSPSPRSHTGARTSRIVRSRDGRHGRAERGVSLLSGVRPAPPSRPSIKALDCMISVRLRGAPSVSRSCIRMSAAIPQLPD